MKNPDYAVANLVQLRRLARLNADWRPEAERLEAGLAQVICQRANLSELASSEVDLESAKKLAFFLLQPGPDATRRGQPAGPERWGWLIQAPPHKSVTTENHPVEWRQLQYDAELRERHFDYPEDQGYPWVTCSLPLPEPAAESTDEPRAERRPTDEQIDDLLRQMTQVPALRGLHSTASGRPESTWIYRMFAEKIPAHHPELRALFVRWLATQPKRSGGIHAYELSLQRATGEVVAAELRALQVKDHHEWSEWKKAGERIRRRAQIDTMKYPGVVLGVWPALDDLSRKLVHLSKDDIRNRLSTLGDWATELTGLLTTHPKLCDAVNTEDSRAALREALSVCLQGNEDFSREDLEEELVELRRKQEKRQSSYLDALNERAGEHREWTERRKQQLMAWLIPDLTQRKEPRPQETP